MKTIRYIIISILLLSSLNSYSQTGYLGKRWHFQMDARFSNAYISPYSSAENWYDFNITYSPTLEFIVNNNFSLGGGVIFQNIEYSPMDLFDNYYYRGDYFSINYHPTKANINIKGYSLFGKFYTSSRAPLGYYYKLQFDYLTYNANSIYSRKETTLAIPKEKIFNEEDWAMGFRVEFGKTVFLNNYLSLGTGLSCGILTKGYGDEYEINTPFEAAGRNLLFNYFFGVNLNIGIMPF